MGRIFFDVSGTIAFLKDKPNYSGIQRVVAMVAQAVACKRDDVYLSFIDPTSGNYVCVEVDPDLRADLSDPRRLRRRFYSAFYRDELPPLRRYAGRPKKLAFHRAKLDMFAMFGRGESFARYNTTLADWQKMRSQPARIPFPELVPFSERARKDDLLLLFDASWVVSGAAEAFERARRGGLSVATLIHDLFPVTQPELVPPGGAMRFCQFLDRSIAISDRLFAISAATASELHTYLRGCGNTREVAVLPLVQQFPRTPESEGGAANMLSPAVTSLPHLPYALFVGTLETRKNLWRLAQAWDVLRRSTSGNAPRLVLAGGRGWFNSPFDEFFAATGGLDGWISIVWHPGEAELAHLYRNCTFFVQVSLAEGWGLPVGEGLSYGKTGVVARATSLPEVGGEMVEYCDPTSIASIAAACERLTTDPGHRRTLEARISDTKLRGWDDVATDLLGFMQAG